MLLNVRSVAVSIAVICFFLMSLIGWASGLTPFVCCKRALIGAVLVYLGGSWAVRAINSILVNAMMANRVDEQAEDDFAETASVAFGDRNSGATD